MGLLEDVAGRLAARDLDERVAGLALAACRGAEALADAIGAGTGPPATPTTAQEATAPVDGRAVLLAVHVAGFRGIGDATRLELDPGPGLTLVVGANGSGKSSFAEAVELALTGDNRRWSRRSKVWRDGWRNLHHPHAEVAVELATDARRTTVGRRWPDDGGLDDVELLVDGEPAEDLGEWDTALGLHRPFLPYSELGAMVDEGPTALHDALSAVLGLDLLTDAGKALREARLVRERAVRAAADAARQLADELAEVDDERARRAVALLREREPDPDAVGALVTGDEAGAEHGLEVARQLETLAGPDLDAVRRAADRLDDAARAVAASQGTDAARDREAAELLERARRFHERHGDGDCPVCGEGALDQAWSERAGRLEQHLRRGAAEVDRLEGELAAARGEVVAHARAVPQVLRRAGVAELDASLAVQTWEQLAGVADLADDRDRAVALRTAATAVANALEDLRQRARAERHRREDRWMPWATRVAAWVEAATAARRDAVPVADLRAAEKALGQVHDEVRAERWTPIADQARTIWDRLRQDSSVAVEDVALAGTGTRRRVEVQVAVDGIEGAALGVMSQGELHALALSLFLPRATLPESPFGFVVVDDPVQSMDLARVEGLARVLEATAATHQVVVFTHDDRLTDAVRRLSVPATVLEVVRGPRSAVDVRRLTA